MSTVHNQAKKEDIAKTVLMPGDPLRAKYIADNFLENAKKVNEVRNMFAFTGTYKCCEVTVMAGGMGIPSTGIYTYELFSHYDVDNIIRIGSSGAYVDEFNMYDVVLAESTWSESSYAETQNHTKGDTFFPSESLNKTILEAAKQINIPLQLTKIHTSDIFYREENAETFQEINKKHGCTCIDMESVALFHNAKLFNKNAATLLAITDTLLTEERLSTEERQNSLVNMMKIALEAAVLLSK